MGFVALSKEAGPVGTMTSGGTDVMEMPASTSRSATVVAMDVVVVGGGGSVLLVGGSVLLDVGRGGIVVVASVVLAAVAAVDGGVRTGAVGATAGKDALGAHPAATSKAMTSAFDLTVPPTTEATVVRCVR
ncbi:MAG TPA: hypothetical protein VGF22_12640 [Acidimicrobiales bacterium]|jgi:hypothetical protein